MLKASVVAILFVIMWPSQLYASDNRSSTPQTDMSKQDRGLAAPEANDVSLLDIGSEMIGTWLFDPIATSVIFENSKPIVMQTLSFQLSGKQVAFVTSGGRLMPALYYWKRKEIAVAEYERISNNNAGRSSVQCTVIGRGKSARLIAITFINGSPYSRQVFNRKDSKGGKKQNTASGYWTKVEEASDEIVKLQNGAIVNSHSYIGYVRYGKRAFLRPSEDRIWIEGKKEYPITVLKKPSWGTPKSYESKTIKTAADDGSVFVFSDGSVFDPSFATHVGGFSDFQSCIIVDGSILLFEDGEYLDSGFMR